MSHHLESREGKMLGLVDQPPVKLNDSVPFVYGSVAFSLGRVDEATTHRWTIYVRGVNGRDLSDVVAKVVFKVHETCTDPVVECTQTPFETTQPGWGEFPAIIEITFKDEKQTTLRFTHELKLHHTIPNVPVTKPVVRECYDEAVFKSPGSDFSDKLQRIRQAPVIQHPLSAHWTTFSEDGDLESIRKAHTFVKGQLAIALKEYAELEEEMRRASTRSQAEATKKSDAGASPSVIEAEVKRVKLES